MKKILSLVLFALACGPLEEAPAPQGETWEQFKERSTQVVDGQVLYIVEWDIAVSHEELRAYYDAHIAASPSADGLGKATQGLLVNQFMGVDDIWDTPQRFNLRYCVSNEFGSLKDRAQSEMWAATAAWEGAANVRFIYDASQDGNCNAANPNVLFSVRPWTGDGACAFFPSGEACFDRTIVMNYSAFNDNETLAVFRHEVGHVLGFRHEHIRPESGNVSSDCTDDGDDIWRALTPYDRESIMHYPICNGVWAAAHSPWLLTDLDRQGAASLYGAGSTPAGTNPIDRSDFFVRQMDRDVLKREPHAGEYAYWMNTLGNCNGNSACLSTQRTALARSLLESPENRQQDPELNPGSPNYNSAFITHCYTNFLRRQPEPGALSYWLGALNSGNDYSWVVANFINSAEYRQRFGMQ